MDETDKKEILKLQEHRPFPLPEGPWVMQQSWVDLLFLHYQVPVEVLRQKLPAGVEVDTYDGQAWLGITPFKMRDVRFRWLPYIPTASDFLEINCRTYVKVNGRPGIYFFSLDANSILSVFGARAGTRLPYFTSEMAVNQTEEGFHYRSIRKGRNGILAEFEAKYRPVSPPMEAAPGSLEAWMVERYCLFQKIGNRRFFEIDIHHMKWPLQQAEARVIKNTLPEAAGFELPPQEPLTHFSRFIKVLVWPMKVIRAGEQG